MEAFRHTKSFDIEGEGKDSQTYRVKRYRQHRLIMRVRLPRLGVQLCGFAVLEIEGKLFFDFEPCIQHVLVGVVVVGGIVGVDKNWGDDV